jgi:WD40-like Beta Propeller Repeat
VQAGRTYFWGPLPWLDTAEFLRQGQNGLRTVQYFDKARMEINDTATRSYHGGVTNGLLVVEMVSGDLKLGMEWFDTERRPPAQVPVAGDAGYLNPDSPTYASFVGVATVSNNGYRDPPRLGQPVTAMIDRAGNLSARPDLGAAHPAAAISFHDESTGHNVAGVFRRFMLQQGPYVENDRVRHGLIIDPVFTMGLPITDPYWVRANVGGVAKDVLVQLFERRVLTYVADNPVGYQVEMGNVGQHYFQWRYPHIGRPWEQGGEPSLPLVAASTAFGSLHFEVVRLDPRHPRALTSGPAESVPFSYRHSYDYNRQCLLLDSRRGDGVRRQIYMIPLSGTEGCPPRRITFSDGTPPPPGEQAGYLPRGAANDYNPAISPDGTKIVFASDREGPPQLYIVRADGGGFPTAVFADSCLSQYPTWGADGRTLYWERQCPGGRFQIMRGDLAYTAEGNLIGATLVNVRALTEPGFDSRYPRMSADGLTLAFTSYRHGNGEIYTMNRDGGELTRLTDNPAEDQAPSWTTHDAQLLFASNRSGNFQIHVREWATGEVYILQLGGESRWPLGGW